MDCLEFVTRNMSLMMMDPLRLVSDRRHLIDEHMGFLREMPFHEASFLRVTTTMTCTAPNGSLPVIPLDKKNMITIKNILERGPDMVHKGKFLLCRSILPPFRMNSLHVVVDDPEDERCLRVSIYNYARMISPGTVIAIMHPWFKRTVDMSASIRVENPMHIHIFDGNECLLRGITWKTPLPKESGMMEEKKKEGKKHVDDLASEGNSYFDEKDFPKAVEAYSKVIQAHPNVPKLYSNRALAFLKLAKPLLALEDIETGLKLEPSNLKLLYRKGKALAMLKQFKESVDFLGQIVRQYKEAGDQKCFKDLIKDVERMDEESNGNYDVMKMIEEAKRSKFLENHADYYASTMFEMKKIEGKGRGLVATQPIREGTLLMACKAFIFVDSLETDREITMNIDYAAGILDTTTLGNKMGLVCQKLMENPDLADEFYQLYAGKKLGFLEKAEKSNPVDMERISEIMRLNAFGAQDFLDLSNPAPIYTGAKGLWIMPSYFNHSCLDANCFWLTIGDFMFIRAKKTIEPGEELLLEYISPWASYQERHTTLSGHFGFECQCRLCRLEKGEPKEVLERFKEMNKIMDDVRKRCDKDGSFDVPLLKSLLKESLKYRPDLGMNVVASRVQKALGAAMLATDPAYSCKLLEELAETRSNVGDVIGGMVYARLLMEQYLFRCFNKSKLAKWTNKAKNLAKIVYGDERLLDVVMF